MVSSRWRAGGIGSDGGLAFISVANLFAHINMALFYG